jgi:signal transduction histidine kinase
MKTPGPPNEVQIPLERVGRFIRQLTHDVRNGLSAVDLETAFITEITADEEVLTELRKLREMISDTAKMLRRISLYFHPVTVHPIPWSASVVLQEIWKTAETELPEEPLEYGNHFSTETVELDLQQTTVAILAVLRNAVQFRTGEQPVSLVGRTEGGQPIIEVHQPRSGAEYPTPPEEWGLQPLLSTRPGGYGLELYQARQIMATQGGDLAFKPTKGELVVQITLPLKAPKDFTSEETENGKS